MEGKSGVSPLLAPRHLLMANQGSHLSLGILSLASNTYNPIFSMPQGDDVVDILDVVVTTTGETVQLVWPLPNKYEDLELFNVSNGKERKRFKQNKLNKIEYAIIGESLMISCPKPSDGVWNKKSEEANCLQITVEDGGPNDNDKSKNGLVYLTLGLERDD